MSIQLETVATSLKLKTTKKGDMTLPVYEISLIVYSAEINNINDFNKLFCEPVLVKLVTKDGEIILSCNSILNGYSYKVDSDGSPFYSTILIAPKEKVRFVDKLNDACCGMKIIIDIEKEQRELAL